MNRRTAVLVLGAGIQGSCTALELAKRGFPVTVLERDHQTMNRASLRNEGKIHLGLVYAKDSSLTTAELQLKGALSFWPLLSQWIDLPSCELAVSTPFHYLVPHDSLMHSSDLRKHYEAVEQRYTQWLLADPSLNYLGRRPERLFKELTRRTIQDHYAAEKIAAGFCTEELSISTEQVAHCIRAALLNSPNITVKCGHTAQQVARCSHGFSVEGDGAHGNWRIQADQVVNATWDGRMTLDRQMGLTAEGWVYRLKYRLIAQLPAELYDAPSITMVLGRYGDVVIHPDHTAYLSWYPAAMRGWSHAISPPDSWQLPSQGHVPETDFTDIAGKMLTALGEWYPGIQDLTPIHVDAGVIVAFGKTDVHDPLSGLHQRTRVGVTSIDGYHSLDGGKLTTAPMFAKIAADRVATA